MVSLKSSIKQIVEYRKERFPIRKFSAVGLFLFVASLNPTSTIAIESEIYLFPFICLLVFQFRLWDDLCDLAIDKMEHPKRVLCRAPSLTPFYTLGGLVFLANLLAVITLWPDLLSTGGFLLLNLFFAVWYSIRDKVTKNLLVRSHIVLLKYPCFVLYTRIIEIDQRLFSLVLTLCLVYLCFSIFEILHDIKIQSENSASLILAWGMVAFCIVLFLMGGELVQNQILAAYAIFLLAIGSSSTFIFKSFGNAMQGTQLGYAVFFIGFSALSTFLLGSNL